MPGGHRISKTDRRRPTERIVILEIYNASMKNPASEVKVSNRGQMCLPAPARRRWGLEAGGSVGVIDLDGSLLLVPGGLEAARQAIREAVAGGRYEAAVASLNDEDLAAQ